MDFAVGQTVKAFRVYQNQFRIGELNRQSNLKTIQGQVDRVELSTAAQQLLEKAQADPFSQVPQMLETRPSGTASQKDIRKTSPATPERENGEFQPLDFTKLDGAEPGAETASSGAGFPLEELF